MKIFFAFLFVPFLAFSQAKKEVVEYNNSIALPFNTTTNTVLNFNTALLQGADPVELIQKRDAVLKSLNSLNQVLSGIKPMSNDYGFYNATKGGAEIYKTYFKNNYTNEQLSNIPATARHNIKKIKDAQKAAEKMNTWNKDFSKRQKKLLLEYKIDLNVDSNMFERTQAHQAAMNYYYEVALNELKVQAFVDDFIDAFNASEKDKIKASQASLKAQIILSNKFMNASKPYKNDDSLLKSSDKVLGFYKKLSLGLIEDVIKFNSFPENIPDDKIDEYNILVDKVNNGVEFLNTLQSYLNESQVVINKFFQTHLY